ncbi:MAG: hypothetical protein IJA46_01585 [Bacteroidaceae bacterium]|nr:hypothetical protein [Bacteroidaceae bacterium]
MKREIIILAICLLTFNLAASARTIMVEEEKEIIHTFKNTGKDDVLKLSNKFGNIELCVWDEDKIKVEATIRVKAANSDRAKEILDGITVVAKSEKGAACAYSVSYRSENSAENCKIESNWVVFVPKELRMLFVINKFGNVNVKKSQHFINAKVKFGDFTAGELLHEEGCAVDVAHGNIAIRSVKHALVLLEFGRLKIERAGYLSLACRHSTVRVNKSDILLARSAEHCSIAVDCINNAEILRLAHSNLNIGSLSRSLHASGENKHSNIKIVVPPSNELENIDINAEFTPVRILLPTDINVICRLTAQRGSVSIDESFNCISDGAGNLDEVDSKKSGFYGILGRGVEDKKPAKITVADRFGDIVIDDYE